MWLIDMPQLRAPTVLAEDLGSVPSTRMAAHKLDPGDLTPLLTSLGSCPHRYIQACTHTK